MEKVVWGGAVPPFPVRPALAFPLFQLLPSTGLPCMETQGVVEALHRPTSPAQRPIQQCVYLFSFLMSLL